MLTRSRELALRASWMNTALLLFWLTRTLGTSKYQPIFALGRHWRPQVWTTTPSSASWPYLHQTHPPARSTTTSSISRLLKLNSTRTILAPIPHHQASPTASSSYPLPNSSPLVPLRSSTKAWSTDLTLNTSTSQSSTLAARRHNTNRWPTRPTSRWQPQASWPCLAETSRFDPAQCPTRPSSIRT